ncbi:unnamed protein product [Coccothraustes coccothraustes]
MSSPGWDNERSRRGHDAAAAPAAYRGRHGFGVRVRREPPQSRARAVPAQGASRLSHRHRGCPATACRRLTPSPPNRDVFRGRRSVFDAIFSLLKTHARIGKGILERAP